MSRLERESRHSLLVCALESVFLLDDEHEPHYVRCLVLYNEASDFHRGWGKSALLVIFAYLVVRFMAEGCIVS